MTISLAFEASCAIRHHAAMLQNAKHALILQPVKIFAKLNQFNFGYFDPINIFVDNKNK